MKAKVDTVIDVRVLGAHMNGLEPQWFVPRPLGGNENFIKDSLAWSAIAVVSP